MKILLAAERSSDHQADEEEGPFVSFADLLFGIIFLFLILIAALLIAQKRMVQEPAAYQTSPSDVAKMATQRRQLEQQVAQLGQQVADLLAQQRAAQPPAPPVAVEVKPRPDQEDLIKTLSAQLAAAQGRLEQANGDLRDLRKKLASNASATSTGAAEARPMLAVNQFECDRPPCNNYVFTGASEFYRAGGFASIIRTYFSAPGGLLGANKPVTREEINSRKCSFYTFTRDEVHSDCSSSYGGRIVMDLHRVSDTVYEGKASVRKGNLFVSHGVQWHVVEIYDSSLK